VPAYVLICHDKPDSVDLRLATRPDHLAYISENRHGVLKLGGPLLNDAEKPVGSLMIIETENLSAAQRFADDDPYAKADLFESVEIKPYKFVAGDLVEK